jgi:hypothetical protein
LVHRAFGTAAGVILGTPGDPAGVLTWTLRRVALRHLTEAGDGGNPADRLLDSESGQGTADWPTWRWHRTR